MTDSARETIRKVINRKTTISDVIRYNSASAAAYTEQPFDMTGMTGVARMLVEYNKIYGGISIKRQKAEIAQKQIDQADNYIVLNPVPLQDIVDYADLTLKKKVGIQAVTYDTTTRTENFGASGDYTAPITMHSSSVRTGYAARLPAGYDVSAIHHDRTYEPNLGTAMQGPFAERHVGGWFHRHTSLNTGSDTSIKRAEAFYLNYVAGTGIILSQSINRNLPHLPPYTREEFAKRPLNIRNIKTTARYAGNYSKDYEVVMTSGRDVNNVWFVQSNAAISGTEQESTTVSGVIDFALANRSKRDHVIAEHFSSPGGAEQMSRGFLDPESETYSIYTGVNYRNLGVRTTLTLLQTHHMSGGYDGIYGNPTASFHKTCANTNPYATGSAYDNWFLQRPIPCVDTGYSWIRYSYLSASWSTLSDPSIEE